MGKTLTTTIRLAGKLDASVDAMIKKTQKLIDNMRKSMSGKGQGGGATAKPFANVEEAVKKSSQSVSVLGKRLNSINDGLKLNPTSLNLITQKQQTLGRMIDTSKTKLAALQQTQQEFISSGGDLGSDKYQELCTEIQNCENALERLNGQQNNFSPRVQQFGGQMTQISEKTGKAAKAFAPVSAAAGAFGVSTIKTAADFDSAMNQIAATKGISTTSSEIQQLRDQAMKLGADTAFSSKEAAEGLNILSMAGYKTDEAIGMSTDMLNLASAGQISMGDSAAYLSTTLKGFGMGFEQSGMIADRIAKGASAAATDVGDLGAAFADAAATSAGYNQNVNDVGVALLRLADQGVVGSRAGTSLAAAEKNLYTASDQGAKALDQLGVSAYDAAGAARPINDVINDITSAVSGMTDQEQSDILSKIFDIQGLEAYRKMAASGADKQKEFQDAMANSGGAAAEMASTQLEGLNGALTELGSAFDNMKIKIGSVFAGPLEKGVDWLTGMISKFNQADGSVHKFAAGAIAIGAGIAPALFGVSKLTGGIGKFIDKAGRANTITGKLAGKMGGLFGKKSKAAAADAAGMNPVAGMSNAIGGETSAAQGKLASFVNSIGGMFKGIGTGISTAFKGIGTGISTALQGASKAISSMSLTGAASFALVIGSVSLALAGLSQARGDIIPFLSGLGDVFNKLVSGALSSLGDFILQIAGVFPILASALASLSPLVEAFGTAIGNAAPGIAAFGTAISDIAQGVGQGLSLLAQGLGQGIGYILGVIGPMAPQIAEAIAVIIDAISNGAAQIGPVIAQIVTALQPIVSDICSVLNNLLSQIGPIIDSIGQAFERLGSGIKTALEGVSGVVDSIGGAIRNFLDGISGVIDSVGNAALNTGRGFKLMGEGLKIITSCNLGSLIGSMGTLAATIGPIAAHGNSMMQLGTGFQTMATSMMVLSASFSSMQGSLQAIPGLLTQVSASMDQITSINDKLAPAVAGVQASLTSMRTAFSAVYAAILTTVTTAMNRLPQITTTAMSQVLTITTTMLSGLSAIVTSMMTAVVAAFQSAMASAVATVSSGMAAIRGMMSVSIQGPRLAVPHVSVSGSFSLNPPSAPSFSVSYYKQGGILSGATMFGMMGDTGLVGGEAGPEAVLPLSTLWNKMDSILTNAIQTAAGYRSMQSRLINGDPAQIPSGSGTPAGYGGINVTFAPVINITGDGKTSEASVSAALAKAKDDFLDELEDLLREREARAYA